MRNISWGSLRNVFRARGGIGPAFTFFLVAPANNLLANILTVQVLGWEIAVADMVAAGISAVIVGHLVSKTPWGRGFEQQFRKNPSQVVTVQLVKRPFDERLWSVLKFAGYLAKRITPAFLVRLVAVSYFQAFFPGQMVKTYLMGLLGVVIVAILGGPLYTPTLIEVVVGRALVDLGMSPAATVAWLMGQPYDIPNSLSTYRIMGWKIVVTYCKLAFIFAVASGMVYGLLTGGFGRFGWGAMKLTSIEEIDEKELELKAKVFKVLGDPNRIKIMEFLRDGERFHVRSFPSWISPSPLFQDT